MALFGGGVCLYRYFLPVYALLILAALYVAKNRSQLWWIPLLSVIPCFLLLQVTPPDNHPLARGDFLSRAEVILAHQEVAQFLETNYPDTPILTCYPFSFELAKPRLGYISHPLLLHPFNGYDLRDISVEPFELVVLSFKTCIDPFALKQVVREERARLIKKFEYSDFNILIYRK